MPMISIDDKSPVLLILLWFVAYILNEGKYSIAVKG